MSTEKSKCAYCNRKLSVPASWVPPVNHDEAWAEIAAGGHTKSCEWVATRAHRLDVPRTSTRAL